mgnify:CR=1 FL=1
MGAPFCGVAPWQLPQLVTSVSLIAHGTPVPATGAAATAPDPAALLLLPASGPVLSGALLPAAAFAGVPAAPLAAAVPVCGAIVLGGAGGACTGELDEGLEPHPRAPQTDSRSQPTALQCFEKTGCCITRPSLP